MPLIKKELIAGLIFILAGFLLIIFRNFTAKKIIEDQKIAWGMNLGEKDVSAARFVILIAGILTILFGLMEMGVF